MAFLWESEESTSTSPELITAITVLGLVVGFGGLIYVDIRFNKYWNERFGQSSWVVDSLIDEEAIVRREGPPSKKKPKKDKRKSRRITLGEWGCPADKVGPLYIHDGAAAQGGTAEPYDSGAAMVCRPGRCPADTVPPDPAEGVKTAGRLGPADEPKESSLERSGSATDPGSARSQDLGTPDSRSQSESSAAGARNGDSNHSREDVPRGMKYGEGDDDFPDEFGVTMMFDGPLPVFRDFGPISASNEPMTLARMSEVEIREAAARCKSNMKGGSGGAVGFLRYTSPPGVALHRLVDQRSVLLAGRGMVYRLTLRDPRASYMVDRPTMVLLVGAAWEASPRPTRAEGRFGVAVSADNQMSGRLCFDPQSTTAGGQCRERAELEAVSRALGAGKWYQEGWSRVVVATLSAHVANGCVSQLRPWALSGWETKSGHPIRNHSIWQKIARFADAFAEHGCELCVWEASRLS